jgi:hypothetical protein
MYKNEGLCPRRDEKKKLSKGKLYSKTKLKKKGREPKAKPDIVLDAILLRRDRSLGPHLVSKKKSYIQNRKGSRAADEDTKDKEIKQRGTLTKKNFIALTGRLQARSPAHR